MKKYGVITRCFCDKQCCGINPWEVKRGNKLDCFKLCQICKKMTTSPSSSINASLARLRYELRLALSPTLIKAKFDYSDFEKARIPNMDKKRLQAIEKALEGMQKQDKALYSQLLALQESIQGLKTELKKEREECEEAFRDLEEISAKEVEEEDEVFVESKISEKDDEQDGFPEDICIHERQDSGISVKTPDAEAHDTKQAAEDSSSEVAKPEIMLPNKQDLDAHVKQSNVEITQSIASSLKPGLIQHSKQDSGILIDEEAVRETKLLSKLVESPEMLENRRLDRMIQNRWLRERPLVNNNSKLQHQRSRSSNDLLTPRRILQHQLSTPGLSPKHSHTNSCPQTALKHPTRPENTERTPLKQFRKLAQSLDETQATSREGKLKTSEVSGQRNTASSEVTPGPRSPVRTSGLKSGLNAKHVHTRSLPTTPLRGLALSQRQLGHQRSARSMHNISALVPTHQRLPHQRSASVVDLDRDIDKTSDAENKAKTKENKSLPQNKTNIAHINNFKQVQAGKDKANEKGEDVQAGKPLRAVLVSASEVTISNIPERKTLTRRRSLDERPSGPGNYRMTSPEHNDVIGLQRRFTMTEGTSQRPRNHFQNGVQSQRFLSPHPLRHQKNHLRHHTMPENDVIRRSHSLHVWHAPSKSWDGYSRKPSEVKRMIRSASQVSLV